MWFYYSVLIVYTLAMLFILAYSLVQANLLFHFIRFKRRNQSMTPPLPEVLPHVTIQLPVFNEKYVVQRLIDAVAKMDYPSEKLEVQILDDSTDETSELIKKAIKQYPDINFQYLHRTDRVGFKAGALREGLAKAKGDFIAIFDADFVPRVDFVKQCIGHFENPKVGLVQSRWTHLNENFSILTRLQAFALDAHFMVEQVGRNVQGAFINFNGTGGIWRKQCIIDAGNWQEDTLTEDLDLSYRAQQKGWDFIYKPDLESPAELPPVMSAIKSQQFRWTKGGAECAVKHLDRVLSQPVGLRRKIHATAHLLNSGIFVAIIMASLSSIPLLWAFQNNLLPTSLYKGAVFFLLAFVIIALVYLFSNLNLAGYKPKAFLRFILELPLFLSVSMGLSIHNGLAVWEGWTGKKSPFIRTPKYNLNEKNKSWAKNTYHQLRIPFSTYLEMLMALVFTGMVIFAILNQSYSMLAFHALLAFGFTLVSWETVKSYFVFKQV